MTIKEFAQLCACGTQTLRYYDRIGLLKPARVDPWSGYRYYDAAQAIAFVKIKNLQAADFSIQEIKQLLSQTDGQVYAAFSAKITQQEQKLERIREIQRSYLTEKNAMEQIIYSMTDYLLSQCAHPEILTEFGLEASDAPEILSRLRQYLNRMTCRDVPPGGISMSVNGEVIQGKEAVLRRIQSLTKENLSDTILLNEGCGLATEQNGPPDPDFSGWDPVWERVGWKHISEFLDDLPKLEPERDYVLWTSMREPLAEDLSFPLFFLGAVLYKQQITDIVVNCASTEAPGENRFKILSRKAR